MMIDTTNISSLPPTDPFMFQDRRINRMLAFDSFKYDAVRHVLHCNGRATRLQPQVGEILYTLLSAQGAIVSRDDLLTAVWGGRCVSPANIDVRIGSLRQALSDCGKEQRIVKTHRNRGFSFIAPVEFVESNTPADTTPGHQDAVETQPAHEERTVWELATLLLRTAMLKRPRAKSNRQRGDSKSRQHVQA